MLTTNSTKLPDRTDAPPIATATEKGPAAQLDTVKAIQDPLLPLTLTKQPPTRELFLPSLLPPVFP